MKLPCSASTVTWHLTGELFRNCFTNIARQIIADNCKLEIRPQNDTFSQVNLQISGWAPIQSLKSSNFFSLLVIIWIQNGIVWSLVTKGYSRAKAAYRVQQKRNQSSTIDYSWLVPSPFCLASLSWSVFQCQNVTWQNSQTGRQSEADIELGTMGHILTLLERVVGAGESLEPTTCTIRYSVFPCYCLLHLNANNNILNLPHRNHPSVCKLIFSV